MGMLGLSIDQDVPERIEVPPRFLPGFQGNISHSHQNTFRNPTDTLRGDDLYLVEVG